MSYFKYAADPSSKTKPQRKSQFRAEGSPKPIYDDNNKNKGAIPKRANATVAQRENSSKKLIESEPIYLKHLKFLKCNSYVFDCPICFKQINLHHGFYLTNCTHTICANCLINYIKKEQGAQQIRCPLRDYGCYKFIDNKEVKDLITVIKMPVPTLELPKPPTDVKNIDCKIKCDLQEDQSFTKKLLEMEEIDLIPNPDKFMCKVCKKYIGPLQGVRLHGCLHDVCKECLIHKIKHSDNLISITCPYVDDDYQCNIEIQQREIKELISTYDYYGYLAKTLEVAEKEIPYSYHCKSQTCHYWWILEDKNDIEETSVLCPACKAINCLLCQAIHAPMSCREYKRIANTNLPTGNNNRDRRPNMEYTNTLYGSKMHLNQLPKP